MQSLNLQVILSFYPRGLSETVPQVLSQHSLAAGSLGNDELDGPHLGLIPYHLDE